MKSLDNTGMHQVYGEVCKDTPGLQQFDKARNGSPSSSLWCLRLIHILCLLYSHDLYFYMWCIVLDYQSMHRPCLHGDITSCQCTFFSAMACTSFDSMQMSVFQASTYATPGGSRAATPGLATDPVHPKMEPKQERAATPPAHMRSVTAEPKQERGRTPPPNNSAAASQGASQTAAETAAGGVSGQQGGALPQAAGGPAGPGPSPRVSPYFSRRSPSPLPLRHSGELLISLFFCYLCLSRRFMLVSNL